MKWELIVADTSYVIDGEDDVRKVLGDNVHVDVMTDEMHVTRSGRRIARAIPCDDAMSNTHAHLVRSISDMFPNRAIVVSFERANETTLCDIDQIRYRCTATSDDDDFTFRIAGAQGRGALPTSFTIDFED